MFMLFHWYCHKGLGCGKMIKFTLKIFNIFGDVYSRDETISLCQRDAGAQIVMSHKLQYTSFGSIPFTPSLVTKWHDRHRYLSIYHVPYLMSLSIPWHCSKTLTHANSLSIGPPEASFSDTWVIFYSTKCLFFNKKSCRLHNARHFLNVGKVIVVAVIMPLGKTKHWI